MSSSRAVGSIAFSLSLVACAVSDQESGVAEFSRGTAISWHEHGDVLTEVSDVDGVVVARAEWDLIEHTAVVESADQTFVISLRAGAELTLGAANQRVYDAWVVSLDVAYCYESCVEDDDGGDTHQMRLCDAETYGSCHFTCESGNVWACRMDGHGSICYCGP